MPGKLQPDWFQRLGLIVLIAFTVSVVAWCGGMVPIILCTALAVLLGVVLIALGIRYKEPLAFTLGVVVFLCFFTWTEVEAHRSLHVPTGAVIRYIRVRYTFS